MLRMCSRLIASGLIAALLITALPAAVQAADPLTVVTYNIRYASPNDGDDVWPNRVEAVSKFLDDFDLIGLQEVTPQQLKDLRERLIEFDFYGVGREDGKSAGEHAAIFYRRDRLKVEDKGTFWLSETPEEVGVKGWDAALPRTCTWMVLNDSGRRLWVANTHFDHRGAKARTESAKLIRRVVHSRSEGLPVLVMGDFNCVPGSEPYLALTDPKIADVPPLVDAREESRTKPSGPSSTWNGFREIAADRIIDHIFVTGPIRVTEFQTLDPRTDSGRFASDHLPVAVTVEVE